jgi:putative PIG3 family NAD(P)H quinone oxidoreductase
VKAIRGSHSGEQSAVELHEIPDPSLGVGEALVRVVASGVNRADLLQRAGKYPPPPGASDVLGLEVSGVIEAVGSQVHGWSVGEEVCALLAGGGYAEKVSVPVGQLMRVPKGITLVQAAAIPEAFLTAYTNLVVEGAMTKGTSVLIHGGSSGVGTAAIQLAVYMGARVVCTVGSEEKAKRCRELGASLAIDYKREDFERAVREWEPSGVDLILDIVGRDYFAKNISVLAPKGRLVCIATMSGSKSELDISSLMRKRLRVIGSVLRSRTAEEKGDLVSAFAGRYLNLFESCRLRPIVHATFPISQVEDAHQVMAKSDHIGKLVLTW